MTSCKILFSNLFYARGIDGRLSSHLSYGYRHFYSSVVQQASSLRKLSTLIQESDPDICCFVEIDAGSFSSAGHNQLAAIANNKYAFFDISCKYAETSKLRSFFLTKGKSNGFMTKDNFSYQRIYMSQGTKRLLYKIYLTPNVVLFFAHFSLNRLVRRHQFVEIEKLIHEEKGEVILLGDFNIFYGVRELAPILNNERFTLINDLTRPTFTFRGRRHMLDLCICTKKIAAEAQLEILPQSFSDHDALLLNVVY